MENPITSNLKVGIEIFKRTTGFYRLGREKYFKRINRIATFSLILLLIIGKIQKHNEFSSFTTTALDIICILLFVFTVTITVFSLLNEAEKYKKNYKHKSIVYLPFLLMVISIVIVTILLL